MHTTQQQNLLPPTCKFSWRWQASAHIFQHCWSSNVCNCARSIGSCTPKFSHTGRNVRLPEEALWAQESYHCGALYHFHKRDQLEGETVTEYDAALRKLATHYQFADYLEEALRNRFVCGLRDGAVQRRLLSEKELSLAKAMDLAVSMEAAEKNTQSVKGHDSSIKQIKGQYHPLKSRSHSQQSCYRCGKNNHAAKDCKFKDTTCHTCGKTGHIAPVCRSQRAQEQGMQQHRTISHQRTNLVQQGSLLYV